jgi:hypothetical protein
MTHGVELHLKRNFIFQKVPLSENSSTYRVTAHAAINKEKRNFGHYVPGNWSYPILQNPLK